MRTTSTLRRVLKLVIAGSIALGFFTNTATAAVQLYFGTLAGGTPGEFAAQFSADGSSGFILGHIPATSEGFAVVLSPDSNGDFVVNTQVSGSPVQRTIRGHVQGGSLTGQIDQLGLTYSASAASATGTTAGYAGYFHAVALNTTDDEIFAIFGTSGEAMILSVSGGAADGAAGTIASGGAFSFLTSAGLAVQGTVNSTDHTLQMSLTPSGGSATSFAGLRADVTRTDRLLNLSARGATSAGDGTLITGFVVAGSAPKSILIRGVGPTLQAFGVTTAASNPSITVLDGTSALVAQNDDWQSQPGLAAVVTASAHVHAFGLNPGSFDSALLTSANAGTFTTQITAPGGGVVLAEIYDASADPSAEQQRLINISTRGNVGTGEAALIGGFVIGGNSPKRVLVRAVGPTLSQFGVVGALADPVLLLYSGTTVIFQNDDWGTGANSASSISAAATATNAFPLQSGSKDSSLVVTLAPGNYTANVVGAGGTSGVALIEIYEVP